MEKVIFDLDPGVDDSMALILALNHPEIDVKLITTVFGNVGLEQTTKNACFIAENFGGRDIPIYYGADKGIKTDNINAANVHGKTGLGAKIVAQNISKIPNNRENYGALEAMRDCIQENKGEINIICVGPTTNLARLFLKYPEVIPLIKRIVLMVGSIDGKGSITPYSSFNAYCDPEAIDVIIRHNIPIAISPKEMGITSFFDEKQRLKFKRSGKFGPFIYDLCEGYKDTLLKQGEYALHDTCALFSILDTDIFTRQKVDMKINVSQDIKRGQTIFVPNKNSNITLLKKADKKKLFKLIEQTLKNT